MSVEKIVDKTAEYVRIPSVIGFEEPFLQHLARDFSETQGYKVERVGRMLAVTKKGPKSSKILTAHIDRQGIIATLEGRFEYAAFRAVKQSGDENGWPESEFQAMGESFTGEPVWAYNLRGGQIAEGRVTGSSYDFDEKDLIYSIDGLQGLDGGSPIALKSELTQRNGRISAQIDNAVSIAVIRQLVRDGFDGTVLLAPDEEFGHSWEHIAAYVGNRETSDLLVLDVTPYKDDSALNQGSVVLRNRDHFGVFDRSQVDQLRTKCGELGIDYRVKDEELKAAGQDFMGITELGFIINRTEERLNGASLQLPTTNYHSNHETTSLAALDNYYKALTAVLSEG
jgi:putative aminopeptidase FrvX